MRSWKEALKDLQIEIINLLSRYSWQYQKEKKGIETREVGVAIYDRREGKLSYCNYELRCRLYTSKRLKETRYSHLRHYGLNVSAPSPNFYVESLIPKVIVVGCGALGDG